MQHCWGRGGSLETRDWPWAPRARAEGQRLAADPVSHTGMRTPGGKGGHCDGPWLPGHSCPLPDTCAELARETVNPGRRQGCEAEASGQGGGPVASPALRVLPLTPPCAGLARRHWASRSESGRRVPAGPHCP